MFHLSKETLLAHPPEACNSLQSRSLLISFHLCILSCWDCWISKSHYVYNHNNPVSVIIHHAASEIDCFLLSVTSWDPSAAAARSLQSCLTLCDPHRRQPTRFPFPGVLQARTLEWVAISFSSAWKWKLKVKSLSRVWHFATPWTAAHQAPPSMGFSRQEYWSGVPSPSPYMQSSPLHISTIFTF